MEHEERLTRLLAWVKNGNGYPDSGRMLSLGRSLVSIVGLIESDASKLDEKLLHRAEDILMLSVYLATDGQVFYAPSFNVYALGVGEKAKARVASGLLTAVGRCVPSLWFNRMLMHENYNSLMSTCDGRLGKRWRLLTAIGTTKRIQELRLTGESAY